MVLERYKREEIAKIWSEQNKYQTWFMIELYACEAMVELGIAPKSIVESLNKRLLEIEKSGGFDIDRINQIDKEVHHDVLAFLTYISEGMGDDSRYIHMGMTSSDILDTSLHFCMLQSSKIIKDGMEKLLSILKKKADAYRYTPCIGRSHGIHAEPMTFGLKMASFYAEFKRSLERITNAQNDIAVCAISGPVGVFTSIDPFIENYVAKKLSQNAHIDIRPDTISTQVISRDRIANFMSSLAILASSIERVALDLRILQMSEILEVEESFGKKQKGSSAMPHKRNPVLGENLTGLSRLIRMSLTPALENIPLWHERDISHSSVERVIIPDTMVLMDYAIDRLCGLIDGLQVYPENMMKNMSLLKGLFASQSVLLALVDASIRREDAYLIVQENAMKVWKGEGDFLSALASDERIKSSGMSYEQLKEAMDKPIMSEEQVDTMLKRVFSQ